MSRNQERLPSDFEESNDSLDELDDFTLSEIVELPSKGKFYPQNNALFGKEEIEIKYPTTKEQDILNNESYIKRGIAIDKMLSRLFVDPNVDPKTLLLGDKAALSVMVRALMLGNDYFVNLTCPICGHVEKDFHYNLEGNTQIKEAPTKEEMQEWGVSFSHIEHAPVFTTTLPKTGYSIEFRLMTSHDESAILKLQQNKKRNKITSSPVTDQLRRTIVGVQGQREQAKIFKFISQMPAIDSTHLIDVYQRVEPSVELETSFLCPMCEFYEEALRVPITFKFFWPNVRRRRKKQR